MVLKQSEALEAEGQARSLGARWYCALTAPRKELIARLNLQRQEFECFLPMQLVTRRHARAFKTGLEAAFPRYIFVKLDLGRDRWRSVNGTVGIRSLLMDGLLPIPVPVGVVETLRESTNDDGLLCYRPALKVGDRVRLKSGPFADALGVLQQLEASGRVRLLLQAMVGQLRVATDASNLVSVAA